MKKIIFTTFVIFALFLIIGCKATIKLSEKFEDLNEPTIETTIVDTYTKTVLEEKTTKTLYFVIVKKDELQYEIEVYYKEKFMGPSFESTYRIETKLWFSKKEWQRARVINND